MRPCKVFVYYVNNVVFITTSPLCGNYSFFKTLPANFSSVTPDQWASLTDSNIETAEGQCKASAILRGVIDSTLNQCARDIDTQRSMVDLSFEKRTQEIADAKQTLEQHLEEVCVHLDENIPCLQNGFIVHLV